MALTPKGGAQALARATGLPNPCRSSDCLCEAEGMGISPRRAAWGHRVCPGAQIGQLIPLMESGAHASSEMVLTQNLLKTSQAVRDMTLYCGTTQALVNPLY